MEAVIRAGIDEGLVFHLGGFQRGLPCGPAGVYAGVEVAEVKQKGALDLGGVFGGGSCDSPAARTAGNHQFNNPNRNNQVCVLLK